MSSYIDHLSGGSTMVEDQRPGQVIHSWRDFTRRRLEWLYGPNHASERGAQTSADVAAWQALGSRRPDAA